VGIIKAGGSAAAALDAAHIERHFEPLGCGKEYGVFVGFSET
jgi:hypothetical protein